MTTSNFSGQSEEDSTLVRRELQRLAGAVGDTSDLLQGARSYAGRAARRRTAMTVAVRATVVAAVVVAAVVVVWRPQTPPTRSSHGHDTSTQIPLEPVPTCSANFPKNGEPPAAGTPLEAVMLTGYTQPDDRLVVSDEKPPPGIALSNKDLLVVESRHGQVTAQYVVTQLPDGRWRLSRAYFNQAGAGQCQDTKP